MSPASLCVAILLAGGLAAPPRPQSLEHEVKAAFLYNFAKFVEWPADAFTAADEPLTFCVIGQDPFGHLLDDLLAGERIRNRAMAVRRLARPAAAAGCHVLFVSPAERARFASILAAVDVRRMLTVSDALEFLEAGGHISFYVEGGRVRFAVNETAVEAAEFRLSSKVLQVARRPSEGAR